MRPIDGITLAEAAYILGSSTSAVRRLILAGRLSHGRRYEHRCISRSEVEALATELYDWRKHLQTPESYWLTGQRAAEVLGVNTARLKQLAARGFLPHETHHDGTRLYRREQLEVVANAREARWR